MPCLYITTNVTLDGTATDSLFSETTKAVAQIIGKPEKDFEEVGSFSWECIVLACLYRELCHAKSLDSNGVTYPLILLQYVMVLLKGSVDISFGGNKEAAAYAEIVSMGGINSQVKRQLIDTIGSILQSQLRVPTSRFFLKVYDTTQGRSLSKI